MTQAASAPQGAGRAAGALFLALAIALPGTAALARPQIVPREPQIVLRPSPEALRSMPLRDSAGQPLGEVSDLVRDDAAEDGVSHVLVALGGFMGMGSHTVAIPVSELRIRPDAQSGAEVLVAPWTLEQLMAVPAYNPADPATLGLVGAEAAGNDVGMTGTAQPPLEATEAPAATPAAAPAEPPPVIGAAQG
ncbi:PRC-barrel domain-containing protein [Frigidibacter sp. MR17.24]|uniref:PRC-barrel domain-containing protein n=1 Tax=Frigidibacter sp. MR17.24 TaxID=3127345 RepID=UPI003012A1EF